VDYKWIALGLLWLAFFLQQGTRQIYGPSITSVATSFGVGAAGLGAVMTVFSIVYGVFVPFSGIAADVFRRKRIVCFGVAVFSLGTFLCGLSGGVISFTLCYGLLNGFGQTFYYPAATSLVYQLHEKSRATAISILQLALYIGIVGCGSAAGMIAGFGEGFWRYSFFILGGAGILLVPVLCIFLKDTQQEGKLACDKGNGILKNISTAFSSVFSNTPALCLCVGLCMMIFVDIGFKTWMPAFLESHHGVSKASAGFNAVFWHYLGAAVGIAVGSRIGDKFAKTRPVVRMEVNIAGLALAIPFIVWMAMAKSMASCCAAMAIFGLFRGVYDSNMMAAFYDSVPARIRTAAAGVMMSLAFAFGALSPLLLGLISDKRMGLSSFALVYLAGAGVIAFARSVTLKKQKNQI
jgi:MFS family permease